MPEEMLDQNLEERLALVSQPEYEGEPMSRADYQILLLTTIALPLVLLVIAGALL